MNSEMGELLDALEDVLFQACWDSLEEVLDSMALTAYANGMRLLAEYGRIEIVNEYGRRVIAKPIERTPE